MLRCAQDDKKAFGKKLFWQWLEDPKICLPLMQVEAQARGPMEITPKRRPGRRPSAPEGASYAPVMAAIGRPI